MFATNFIIDATDLTHIRGQDALSRFAQSATIASGNEMANYFCRRCGTLMYRVSSAYPDKRVLRLGTVDDYTLHETVLKPRVELFSGDRVAWLDGVRGVEQLGEAGVLSMEGLGKL
jgi:hypothetical protein